MKRRQVLQQLLYSAPAVVAASFLSGCGTKQLSSLFATDLRQPDRPLPEHLITPLSEFYVQSYALPSRLKAEDWQLQITGAVNRPLTLSLEDVLAAPQEDFHLTMECIGNPTGGNLIGNALWTGTPLLPFLERSQIQSEAIEFKLHGADWYETTLPVSDVMRSDVRLVHQMNGEPLTAAHGYPVRLIVPGHFGQKQPKWLVKIEAIATPKQGYWERQGWSNIAEIPTHALTRQVQQQRVWNRQHQVRLTRRGETGWQQGVLVGGVALDRSSPIESVQISTDGGQTWQTAQQNHPASPHEWTLWRYLWQPDQPGQHTLLAQAISQRQTQPLEDANSRDGSSGMLEINVTLQT